MTGLRVAFVGAGRRSVQSARVLLDSGVGRPVGFWNRDHHRAAAVAAEFGLPAYGQIGTMVEQTRPDLVAIMTDPAARAELVEQATAAGARALLIEKPVALTAAELERIEHAACDAFVVVNTQYQWMPHWQRFLADVTAGHLGELRSIRASVGVDVLEQGPHALSLAMAVADAAGLPAPTWVLAGADGRAEIGGVTVPADLVATYDLGDARLSLAAGPSAPLVPGESVRPFQQQTELVGSDGRIWVSLNQGAQRWITGAHERITTRWETDDVASQSGLFAAIAEALDDPVRQSSFPTRLASAAVQARMLFGAIRSAEVRTRVELG